jgi:ubiquitin-protein ligase
MYTWHANIRGPAKTAYQGGVFHMQLDFPEDYPLSPPSVTLFSEVPHPNVFGRTLCLDMLQKNTKGNNWYEGWSPCYTVQSILIQL